MARLFDAYVMVDWSAAAKPASGADSIWIGVAKRDVRFRIAVEVHNPTTRAEAEKLIRALLADFQKRSERVLIGFDFALGYPAGTAAALKLDRQDWLGLWKFLGGNVVDKPDNTNNRFAVASKMNRLMTDAAYPFWGCPPRDAQRWLTTTKATDHPAGLPVFRATEIATQGLGKAGAKPLWQLYGAGNVGSQTVMGIPAVLRLYEHLGDKAAVWPFTTGWKALAADDVDGKAAVIAEIYPALIPTEPRPGEIRDAAQVRTLAEHFAKLDDAGKLGALFAAKPLADIEAVQKVEQEEGWILGA